jgi:hypothetical protein
MPPKLSVFRSSGSKDDAEVTTTGWEMFQFLKLHRNKPLLTLSFIASIAGGCMPLMMSETMGGMMDSMTNGKSMKDFTLDLIIQMIIIQAVSTTVMSLSFLFRVIYLISLKKSYSEFC